MTPDDRRAETARLCKTITDIDPVHTATFSAIQDQMDAVLSELDETEHSLNESECELDEARERATEAEGRVEHDCGVPIWHEAKGRMMEGQDAVRVLEWVLSHLAGEPVVLTRIGRAFSQRTAARW